jgi:hypothetical protein
MAFGDIHHLNHQQQQMKLEKLKNKLSKKDNNKESKKKPF